MTRKQQSTLQPPTTNPPERRGGNPSPHNLGPVFQPLLRVGHPERPFAVPFRFPTSGGMIYRKSVLRKEGFRLHGKSQKGELRVHPATWITSVLSCLHLNIPQTDAARSIRLTYFGLIQGGTLPRSCSEGAVRKSEANILPFKSALRTAYMYDLYLFLQSFKAAAFALRA